MLKDTGNITNDTKVSEVIKFLQDYVELYGDQRFNIMSWADDDVVGNFQVYTNELVLVVED